MNPIVIAFNLLAIAPVTLGESLGLPVADIAAPVGWHAQSLTQALAYMILFGLVGVLLAIAGYKLFDKCTPGDLHKEIIEQKNIAAAIIGGSVILGVCLLVAASMLG